MLMEKCCFNSCAADETWKWMNDDTRNFSRQERFSFGFSESFGVNSVINLKCSIVICARLPDHSIPELTLVCVFFSSFSFSIDLQLTE